MCEEMEDGKEGVVEEEEEEAVGGTSLQTTPVKAQHSPSAKTGIYG